MFKDFFKNVVFSHSQKSALLVAVSFFLTSVVLFLPKIIKEKKNTSLHRNRDDIRDLISISYGVALAVGVAQMVAIFPGISRSGMTIVVALLLGVKRKVALQFSFLLSIPTILGSFFFEIKDLNASYSIYQRWDYGLAFVIAFIVGLFSLQFLQWIVQKNHLHFFSYYLLMMGILTLTFLR